MEADSDIAFALQMEEALTASLLDSAAPSSDVSYDTVLTSTLSNILQNDNLSKCEQELLDQYMTEAEAERLRLDLRRQIHDRAFACEILNVPEEEWSHNGDNLSRPFGEGSSSSSSNGQGLGFKVYVNGLVEGTVGGIGVAICDGNDGLVFELTKSFNGKDQEVNEVLVAYKALIEGIDAAIMLDLKRLTFVTDNPVLYQYRTLNKKPTPAGTMRGTFWILAVYFEQLSGLVVNLGSKLKNEGNKDLMFSFIFPLSVNIFYFVRLDNENGFFKITGNNPPMSENVSALANQINLLLRKLSYPLASLVAINDIKFAVGLARKAIAYQVNHSTGNSNAKNLTECCSICTEDTYVDQMFIITTCQHSYCFSCMSRHVQFKLLQGILPKCPYEKCLTELKLDNCRKFLSPELIDIMSQRLKEASIPPAERVYCPYPRCSTLLSKNELQGSMGNSSASIEILGCRKCPQCSGLFCINCQVPWHSNMNCFDFKRKYPYPSDEEQKLKNLSTQSLWRQCPKCNHMVSLAAGCYHIYCRCGHEFCYTCGAEWKNKKATCTCPIWDERNILYGQ